MRSEGRVFTHQYEAVREKYYEGKVFTYECEAVLGRGIHASMWCIMRAGQWRYKFSHNKKTNVILQRISFVKISINNDIKIQLVILIIIIIRLVTHVSHSQLWRIASAEFNKINNIQFVIEYQVQKQSLQWNTSISWCQLTLLTTRDRNTEISNLGISHLSEILKSQYWQWLNNRNLKINYFHWKLHDHFAVFVGSF